MLTVTNGANFDWGNMPLSDMAFGCAMDCDFTLRAWNILKEDINKLHLNHVYDNLLKSIVVTLAKVEYTGIKVDKKYLAVLEDLLSENLASLVEEINELNPLDDDINPNSTAHVGTVLFTSEGFGLTATEFSAKTKKPSITESHLTDLLEKSKKAKVKEFILKLLEYKSKSKLYKTYVKGVESSIKWNDDGRIYSSYNFAATVTGRLSCSQYSAGNGMRKGVSFHTLPRPTEDNVNIRKLMISDTDKVFIAADYSQAELRVLAQCCKDENLLEAFNSGVDLHRFTASLVFGKEASEVTKEERQIAKSVSFLIVYGGGPHKLSQQIGESIGYCKGIFKAYQDSYPKVFSWIKFVHKYIRENEHAVSLFGRRRNLPNVSSPIRKYQFRALRQGMNFVIQSSASDMMLQGILGLEEALKASGVDAQILASVHDSVEIQCAKSDTKQVLELVKSCLTDTTAFKGFYNLDFAVPFEVDVEVGNSFGDATEAHFDDVGQLTNLNNILDYVENQ